MIYFDNSATTKPYPEVIDSFVKVSQEYFANPSSLHILGGQAEGLITQARNQVAQLLNTKAREIYFTSGGTESNNMAIKGAAMMYQNRGNHIITSVVEHASVREPMEFLKDNGFEITYLSVGADGRINIDELREAIRKDTIMVSIMHVNNEVGTIQPIKEIGEVLRTYPKILFHVDNVQGIGKVPLDIYQSKIDLYTISSHKIHGLKGNGVLYIRDGVNISPLFNGGNQEWQRRSGTENVAGIVSTAKALRMTMLKYDTQINNIKQLKSLLYKELSKEKNITVHTPPENSAPHIINFSVVGFKSEVFVHALGEKNIYVSTTSACSSKVKSLSHTLLAMGVEEDVAKSAIRISLSFNNTESEALKVIEEIRATIFNLGRIMNT